MHSALLAFLLPLLCVLPWLAHILLSFWDETTLEAGGGHNFRYKLRANVDVADVSDEYVPWVRFGADAEGVMQPGADSET